MKKIVVSLLLFVALFSSSAYAKVNDAYQQGSAIVVNGNIDKAKKGVYITLIIAKQGATIEDINTDLKTNVYALEQTKTDAEGNYNFKVFLDDGLDVPNVYVRVGESNIELLNVENVKYSNVASVKNALDAVNSAYYDKSSQDERREALISAIKLDAINLSQLSEFEDFESLADKTFLADYLLDEIKREKLTYSTDDEFGSSIARLKKCFKDAVAISTLNQCQNESDLKSAFIKFEKLFDIDVSKLDGIAENDTYFKKAFDELSPKTVDEVSNGFDTACVFAEVNSTVSWLGLKIAINKGGKYLGIENEDLNKITNEQDFYKYYAKYVPFLDIDDVSDKFDYSLSNYKTKEKGASTSGGGGGGGNTKSKPIVSLSTMASDVVSHQVKTGDKTEVNKNVFSDVEDTFWAKESIEFLYEKKIVNGASGNKFEPNRNITRAEFIKMVLNAFNVEMINEGDLFADVSENDWYSSVAKTAKKEGIVNGDDLDCFNPNKNITRQDMAVIIYRCMKLEQSEASLLFADFESISDYAVNAVSKLSEMKIINGYDDNTFRPNGFATRAEASKMVYFCIKK